MASLSITYTPNYNGCHRIGVRTDGIENPYCIYTDYSPSIIGEQKTTIIELDESFDECIPQNTLYCSNVTIEGYVQACCSDENDPSSFVTFKFDVEVEKCESYAVLCTKAGVANIVVTNPGSGYVSTPSVLINSPGGGSGFSGTVVMDGDTVDSITILNSGDGYPKTATVRFTLSPTGDNPEAYIEFCPCGPNCGAASTLEYIECIDGNTIETPIALGGEQFTLCSKDTPVVTNAPSLLVAKLTTSYCCSCQSYRITNNEKEKTINMIYIDCNNVEQQTTLLALANVVLCMVPNSLHLVEDYLVTIVDLGECS